LGLLKVWKENEIKNPKREKMIDEELEKQKEIEELSKQLLAKEKWCVIIDRPCMKERCSWYDIAEERCIVITIANILAGQKVVR